nr:MAG TPA: hypothetical protein [Caudoviricetes sp.]
MEHYAKVIESKEYESLCTFILFYYLCIVVNVI